MQKRLEPLLPTHILGKRFEAEESAWNLSVIFDCDLCFTKQVDAVYKLCFVNLCDMQRMHLSEVG